MSGFVVCQKCGTRIKAGRAHCLKCFELLPDPAASVRAPLWESLGLSPNAQIAVWAGAAIAVALLGMVIWQTWPSPGDDIPEPASYAGAPPANVANAPSLEVIADAAVRLGLVSSADAVGGASVPASGSTV